MGKACFSSPVYSKKLWVFETDLVPGDVRENPAFRVLVDIVICPKKDKNMTLLYYYVPSNMNSCYAKGRISILI